MITKTKYKVCRRLGPGIYSQCQTQKFALSESKKGQKTSQSKRPKPLSNYGRQLVEKQKLRFTYGLNERQFSNYVKEAIAQKNGDTAQKLFELLELRLDNIIYRLGLASSRRMARQIVSHGHIAVNDRKITVPSFRASSDSKIKIKDGSVSKTLFSGLEEKMKDFNTPSWLSFDLKKKEAVIKGLPKIESGETFDFKSVLEFYKR